MSTRGMDTVDWREVAMAHLTEPAQLPASAPRARVSALPVFSEPECDAAIAFAIAHRSEWMGMADGQIPTPYVTVGGDANFASAFTRHKFAERWPNGVYSLAYGFARTAGRLTGFALSDPAHMTKVHRLYRAGVAPLLERLRAGLAGELGVAARQVVLGGDEGTVLADLSPPAMILQMPNKLLQYYLNPHHDAIEWHTDSILRGLGQGACAGNTSLFGGTLALQLPRAGGGLWSWHYDEAPGPPARLIKTAHKRGYLTLVPGTVRHSIAPWAYRGWWDEPRWTMQMFMLRCGAYADNEERFYVFH